VVLLASTSVGACASQGGALSDDPFEPLNRSMFLVDGALDTVALAPTASAYRYVLPGEVRSGIRNVLDNLDAPYIVANDLLQGQTCVASEMTARFLVNSTLGLGGIFDVASGIGMPEHRTDLAVTLQEWGAGPGPYVVLPVIGPSDTRGAVARVTEFVADPADLALTLVWPPAVWGRLAVEQVHERSEESDDVAAIAAAPDPYAAAREAYWKSESIHLQKPAPQISTDCRPSIGSEHTEN
jgi:phospholipid-binding lipoprotein MlaA